jgi:hypothetical protein
MVVLSMKSWRPSEALLRGTFWKWSGGGSSIVVVPVPVPVVLVVILVGCVEGLGGTGEQVQ